MQEHRLRRWLGLLYLSTFGLVLGCWLGGGQPRVAPADAQEKKAVDGAASYQKNCAFCHGKEGKGDGVAAYLLWPKPRDFTRGLFKIRSTPDLPTDEDLYKTITEGLPGSAMLAWKWMPEEERRALVQEVKRLSSRTDEDSGETINFFTARPPGPALVPPLEPALTPQSIARGGDVFRKMECSKCHGGEGKGDGPSSVGLKDDWGQPIRPRDFTSGVFKGGSANADLYKRIALGIGGTPMPAFKAPQITDEERWDLVHFVHSLTRRPVDKPAIQAIEGELAAAKVAAGEVPLVPEDPRWDKVAGREIPLILLFQRSKAAEGLIVKAVHDGKTISFLLDWADTTRNAEPLRVQDFRDGAAIQFAPQGPETPLMGAPGNPVNIWHWKADWQAELGDYRDVERAYPGMQMDMYPLTSGEPTISHGGTPPSGLSTDPTFLTGTAAKNPLSATRRRSPVEDLNAVGFGTLTSQPPEQQNVAGCGAWMGERWRVVFTRVMDSPDANDAKLLTGTRITLSFAVWDGAARDRDGQKSVTTWYPMRLE